MASKISNMMRNVPGPTSAALLMVLAGGCKKDPVDTAAPADAEPTAAPQPQEPDVPQDPDPAELAEARRAYVLGHYPDVIEKLSALYGDLKERSQYRAGGLAGGWLALAHARDVVENSEEPGRHAIAMGDRTADPEVQAVAKMAWGAYLLGTEDFAAAQASFEGATALSTADAALAHVLLAEALIGRAFGGGDSTTVQRPQDLDAAGSSYEKAAKNASGDLADALRGRAHEGLAALAKYQGKREKICEHAKQAKESYDAAGAAEFLKEGPKALLSDARCK